MTEHLKNTRITTAKTLAKVQRNMIKDVVIHKVISIFPETYSESEVDYFREVNHQLLEENWFERTTRFNAIDDLLDLFEFRHHLTNYAIGVTRLSTYLNKYGIDLTMIAKNLPRTTPQYATDVNQRLKTDKYVSSTIIRTFSGEDAQEPTSAILMDALCNSAGPKTVLVANHFMKTIVGEDSPEYREFIAVAWNRLLGYGVNPNQLFGKLIIEDDKIIKPTYYVPKPTVVNVRTFDIDSLSEFVEEAQNDGGVKHLKFEKLKVYRTIKEDARDDYTLDNAIALFAKASHSKEQSQTDSPFEDVTDKVTYESEGFDNAHQTFFTRATPASIIEHSVANLIGTGYVEELTEDKIIDLKRIMVSVVMQQVSKYNREEACEVYEHELKRLLDISDPEPEVPCTQRVLSFDQQTTTGSWTKP